MWPLVSTLNVPTLSTMLWDFFYIYRVLLHGTRIEYYIVLRNIHRKSSREVIILYILLSLYDKPSFPGD